MKHKIPSDYEKKFYGTVSLGEKGQIVVPVEARKALKLQKGEQLLVFGMGGDMLAIMKLDHVEKIAEHLSKKLQMISGIIQKTKKAS